MNRLFVILLTLSSVPLFLSAQADDEAGPETDENFSSRVTTQQKPWTKREFRNDPKDFQFAIVTDRTGGMRPGVFSRAVKKVNELQPEFVITVGDLIPGGGWQKDEKEIRRQWKEFNGFVDRFEMPFFYLPGNHDVSNGLMDRIWDEKYGVRYYSFVYKDVLFLCLNTQDGEGSRPFIGKEQIDWVKEELAHYTDVRWTMVFIHQPLWNFEEGIMRNVNGRARSQEIENRLARGRGGFVRTKAHGLCGACSSLCQIRKKRSQLLHARTTGGGSALRGSPFGEFDHASWITMTDEGPRMMNLTPRRDAAGRCHDRGGSEILAGLKFTENYRETFPFRK